MPSQLGFHVDSSVCINCKTCRVACQEKHDLPAEAAWRRVTQYGGGSWVSRDNLYRSVGIFTYSVSIACNHCASPACMKACPQKAISKRGNGAVVIDAHKCIGCRNCERACPYGAPQYNSATKKMTKCDFCQDLLAVGRNPACVDACTMRALHYGPLSQLRSQYGNVDAVEPLPVASLTHPSLVITPHRHSQAVGKGTGRILHLRKAV